MDKALFDRNEQMSYNYILDMLKKMLDNLEKRIASKKNENEFFVSQMNPKEENDNYKGNVSDNNNIKINNKNNQNQAPKKTNNTYDETNVVEEMISNEIK